MEISLEEFFRRAKALYGEDLTQIKFKCPNCQQIQTGQSVYAKVKTNATEYSIITCITGLSQNVIQLHATG